MSDIAITVEKSPDWGEKPDLEELGFGKRFSHHMLVARYQEAKGWEDCKIQPFSNLSLNPAACVLHYGQALFEGMKAYRWDKEQVALFRPEFNWRRMVQGCERLCMQAPPQELFVEGIRQLVQVDRDWVPSEPDSALYIRPTLVATEGFLGIRPSKEYLFFVILCPVGPYYAEGMAPVKIWIEQEFLRAAPGGLGFTKAAANYAGSLKASEEAKARGYTQVLWLDVHRKQVEEVGTMNVFFVFADEIVTPALSGTILGGKTRDSAIRLLRDRGHNVSERPLPLAEIRQAYEQGRLREVFGTGTAAVISPVGELASNDFQLTINKGQTGAVSDQLYKDLTDIQYGRKTDPYGWTLPL
jgi:branched-chain amino acid aminotransferase